jgi:hypothetical protein
MTRIALKRRYRWLIWGLIITAALVGLAGLAVSLLRCRPIELNWAGTSAGDPRCLSSRFIDIFSVAKNSYVAVTDMVVAILPIFLLWNIKMRLKLKILTNMVLGLGML